MCGVPSATPRKRSTVGDVVSIVLFVVSIVWCWWTVVTLGVK